MTTTTTFTSRDKLAKTTAKVGGDYVQIINPQGYLANREITNLPGQFLVRPSLNTFIKNAEKVMSRNGHTLLGPSKSSSIGCNGSYDWNEISSGSPRSLRQRGNTLEVFYAGQWLALGFTSPLNSALGVNTLPARTPCAFSNANTWWSATELIDFLIFAQGGTELLEWSGAISVVAGVTSNTITKQKYLSGTDIAFVNNGVDGAGNTIPGAITKATGGFLSIANFQPGDLILPSGTTNNNTVYLVTSVTDTALTIDPSYTVTTETPLGTTVLELEGGSTWAAERAHDNNAGDANDRAFTIDGVKYIYTGGETTGTLTGVTPNPLLNSTPIAFGDIAIQTVRSYSTITVGATGSTSSLADYSIDIVWCIQNQIVLGSFGDRRIFISKDGDFTDYSYTSPLRLPGEGATITLDASPTGFAKGPLTTSLTAASVFYVTAAPSRWYRITFYQQTQTDANGVSQLYETTPVQQIPTGTNSAAISQSSIVDVKNGEILISFEPAIDSLAAVVANAANTKSEPISDPIKDDIEMYNLSGAHGVYIHRTLFYTLPAEGLIIPFDYVNGYWQPPQTGNFSRLAIIDIDGVQTLCGHAADSNETYILFTGFFDQRQIQVYTDNNATILATAAFGYENFGSRFTYKRFDEMATELYIAPATVVHDDCYLDYGGSTYVNRKEISVTANPNIAFQPVGNSGEGQTPEGYSPQGSTTDVIPVLIKCKVINDCSYYDFFERQRVFWTDTLGGHFEIIAYGENVMESPNLPTDIHQ